MVVTQNFGNDERKIAFRLGTAQEKIVVPAAAKP
jgi:hypothetical protein